MVCLLFRWKVPRWTSIIQASREDGLKVSPLGYLWKWVGGGSNIKICSLRLCPLDKGSDGSPGWQDAPPAGLYRVLSRSVLKTAHSFCLTAQIVMWIWFQCYAHIALPFKMKYLHLLELGMFYNRYVRTLLFVEPLFPWWMQCVYSKVPVTFALILWGCVISRSFVVLSWGHDI